MPERYRMPLERIPMKQVVVRWSDGRMSDAMPESLALMPRSKNRLWKEEEVGV